MKIKKIEYLIKSEKILNLNEYKQFLNEIKVAISKVKWPKESNRFTIHPKKNGNGVKPLKEACMLSLEKNGWMLEKPMDIATNVRPGPIDAFKQSNNGNLRMAVEWETGNISSSHRAVNKMCVGLLKKKLNAGALILPTKKLYRWLTDRVGNYAELQPYFGMWKELGENSIEGNLLIIAVEHDDESREVPRINKGTDGRALV